jgi:hypothetical protein
MRVLGFSLILLYHLFAEVAFSEAIINNQLSPFAQSKNTYNNKSLNPDTSSRPLVNSITADDKKVIMSTGENTFELSPLSTFNNGAVIQPINKSTNSGISTAFYLKDNSNWSFYTDSKLRLTINGEGDVSTTTPLLINNAVQDGTSALRVNGNARFDSTVYIQDAFDTSSFISIHRNIKNIIEGTDPTEPYTTTPTAWALGHNIPAFRLRHRNKMFGTIGYNISSEKDFLILPYEFGTAIEYNGVVECWVGEWSIHKGLTYHDVEGKGNGWGGVLWVGDDEDRGGVRATARNNTMIGGNIAYGELSVEKFGGSQNGDFRLRLPSTTNQFQFVYGERGSENVVAKLSNQGLIIPKVSSISNVISAEVAQILFDSTEKKFMGFNGTNWLPIGDNSIITGSYSFSGDGLNKEFVIPHGVGFTPSYYNINATSADAGNFSYITADSNFIYIHYNVAPITGSNNLSWNWLIKK